MKTKVKIISCISKNYWYNNSIGDVFEVEFDNTQGEWKTYIPFLDNICGWIVASDALVIVDFSPPRKINHHSF